MNCPYLNCKGCVPLPAAGHVSVCGDCHLPVLLCDRCAKPNRSLARFCASCGSSIPFPEKTIAEQDLLNRTLDLTSPARTIRLAESIWVRPLAYRGFLWCLSQAGNLYGISPFKERPEYFCPLGESFGKCPGLVQEWGSGGSPLFLALGNTSLKSVNLLNWMADEFQIELDPGEKVLSDIQEGFFSLEAKGESVFFLTRTSEELRLAAFSLKTGKTRKVPLPETTLQTPVVGPIKAGGKILAYSLEALYQLTDWNEEWKLTPYPFNPGFRPLVSPETLPRLLLEFPLGVMPPLVAKDYLYIPGTTLGEGAFLMLTLGETSPTVSILKVPPGVYDSGSGGELVFASKGKLILYRGLLAETQFTDEQILGERGVFYENPIGVTFAVRSVGGKVLRWYLKGNGSQDYPFGDPRDFAEALGFFAPGGCVTFLYTSGRDSSTMIVWDLYI